MTEFFLDADPLNRAFNTFELDGETIIIRRYWESEDVAAILAHNHYEREHAPAQRGDVRRTARIPDMVQYLWLQQLGVRAWDPAHEGAVTRLLNDREWYKLRTGGGRL